MCVEREIVNVLVTYVDDHRVPLNQSSLCYSSFVRPGHMQFVLLLYSLVGPFVSEHVLPHSHPSGRGKRGQSHTSGTLRCVSMYVCMHAIRMYVSMASCTYCDYTCLYTSWSFLSSYLQVCMWGARSVWVCAYVYVCMYILCMVQSLHGF